MDKLHKGIITRTHFSDILRLELLIQNGGTWIDATVFCSGGDIPKYMMEDEFFIFQKVKPGSDGSAINMSSWFMSAWSNHKFLLATRELLYAYWRKNDRMIDYFLLHLFMMIVKDYYMEEWFVKFANNHNTYIVNQKENFKMMKDSFENYLSKMEAA